MAGIVWLASYPKSGNTWVRVFLTNYLRNAQTPANINELDGGPIAANRRLFDDAVGVEASDLSPRDIAACRAAAFRQIAEASPETVFLKIHDAYRCADEPPLIPADATLSAIYIVRNPLDVAVSFANHEGVSIDESVRRVCERATIARSVQRLRPQLEQHLLSWGDHVVSWVDQTDVPCVTIRYEDLLRDAESGFRQVVMAAHLPLDAARLARATAFSSFDAVRQQESAVGFREKPRASAAFFRRGRSGDWREALTAAQVARIVDANAPVMARFGYLPDPGATRGAHA